MEILKVLSRIYIDSSDLYTSIKYYENLFDKKCKMIIEHPAGLELAVVGPILLIAGSEDDLKPFKETSLTFLVDSINEFRKKIGVDNTIILSEPREVPTGMNMRVQHPDGVIVEYVEFKKNLKLD
ncbi:hypothetical protein [Methanobacterium alcaliphilum]|uniref:hypothetical protein n=1 Tax=Methanobacterium alcaliphilum TaxID=392018 RepID=UPI00200A5797|nr:hypothetical protein [Methanobacterium alcaliphilum]MCK9152308.1 hypothetical protein [Methanobacterium alcaliphilum]